MNEIEQYINEYKRKDKITSTANRNVPVPKEEVFGKREQSEQQVREALSGDISRLNLEDWDWIVKTMNDNGFEWGHRFSIYFYVNSFSKGIKKKGAPLVNRAVMALVRPDRPMEERIQEFQGMYGTPAPGLFSGILYVLEPGTFFPWTGALNKSVMKLGLVNRPLKLGSPDDYVEYCHTLSGLMKVYGLRPQEIDYVLTTGIESL